MFKQRWIRYTALVAFAALMSACSGGGGIPTTPSPSNGGGGPVSQIAKVGNGRALRSCAAPLPGDDARCFAQFRIDTLVQGQKQVHPNPVVSGYGPSDLQSAYALPSSSAGSGQTVAIVDAYDDPTAEADLGVYRSNFGLPACTTANGCFKKVSQTGTTRYPRANGGWAQEISLDLDMVSAICPNCHILLVEATSATNSNLATAENEAATLHATEISNSYGGGETGASNSAYSHSGIIITASAGDSGTGAQQPCSYATVVCAGGTSLSRASTTRGWTETAWSGSGSGCSAYVTKPSWQTDTGCTNRSESDVSAVADPNTGVAVYDSYAYSGYSGWLVFGGTSVSSPLLASVYALAGNAGSLTVAQSLWQHLGSTSLNDVTSGSNGTCSISYICNAGPGYDGPTGVGTPEGVGAF